ncbi:MAG: undecaprenyldiphospho-muramoylpentapeptide beta-N-acetylglucosaminyltransferase [Bacteroidaceae bacterium]|nr:undecaprenyldiphospho-muramoylpentapeptide beta-N-acetylglucosaminyltransferase [Bacteroidaceae bacterium]
MENKESIRVIVSGGGTGGHIFPAISIANALKAMVPDAEILFVGAEGRMEMQRVPAAGYKIIGLPVAGFDRKNLFKNIPVLIKLFKSQMMARKIIKDFKPMVVVGVGGYASGPTLKMAASMGIPTLIQEQNSYAGVTNKLLSKSARRICVAYEGMDRFFPKDKIVLTGNPVRQGLVDAQLSKKEAVEKMGLNPERRTVLIIGGSLGARTMNESVIGNLSIIREAKGVQFVWQTGKYYSDEIKSRLSREAIVPNLKVTDFVSDMASAYAAADLVVSRAGASSISELCVLHKPSILVPSPNVAEDHQTKNAKALSTRGAALFLADADAVSQLVPLAIKTVADDNLLASLGENAGKMAFYDSANVIAKEVLKLAEEYNKK